MKEIGIYIHIPFCIRKCNYCDFTSYANCSFIEKYIQAVSKEIEQEKEIEEYIVTTIYIGGGTPSSIDAKYIGEVLNKLKEKFNIKEDAEITIEINPGTVNIEKLTKYKEYGINRLSIGLQETDNKLLKMLGRIHTYEEFLNAYNMAKDVGFNNINVDLMIGLPNQNLDNIKKSLENIIKLSPKHISVYSLIVEEGTVICKEIESGILNLPDEELEREQYWFVKNILEKNGYVHYEISNFAKNGFESKHNMNCWEQKEYFGFGLAAHSYINKTRYSNLENLKEYIQNLECGKYENNRIINEKQDTESEQKEYMLLGLRKLEGVSIGQFKLKFNTNPLFKFKKELNKLANEELIVVDGDNIKLSSKGLDLANVVWEEFV